MSETGAIDVVSDANVALTWFHSDREQEVEAARRLLDGQRERTMALHVLDLTAYEVGNALLRGRAALPADRVAEVLGALSVVSSSIAPTVEDLSEAARLAEEHDLTLYDAAYAAVARRGGALLATLDRKLLRAGLGRRPSEIVRDLPKS